MGVVGGGCGGDARGGEPGRMPGGGMPGSVGKRAARASRASERYRGRFPIALASEEQKSRMGSSLAIEVPKGRGGAAASGGGKLQGPERERRRQTAGSREVDKWRRRGIVACSHKDGESLSL